MLHNGSADAVSLLFESDAQPVIGVNGRTVRFLNLAARRLFGDVPAGTALRRLLPEHAALHQGSVFFATAKVRGVLFCIAASSMPGIRIFRLEPVRTDGVFPEILMPGDVFSMELGLAAAYFSAHADEYPDNGCRHYAARLERTADQLRRWMNNVRLLQTLRRSGTPRPAQHLVDCAAVMAAILETSEPLLLRRGVRIVTELPESGCPVRANAELLEALVLNLLSNAVQSAGDGAEIRIQLTKGVHTAHLIVRDPGEGFPEGTLTDVFHAYAMGHLPRSGQDGAGFGLPVCFAVMAELGGSILIENKRGGAVHAVFPVSRSERLVLHAPPEAQSEDMVRRCRTALSGVLTEEDYL